jgi:predicted NAD/FAD-binding protein
VFLRFLDMHGMLRPVRPLRWRTIVGGSRNYVDRLLARLPSRLHLGIAIRSVARDASSVVLCGDDGRERRFDRVVLAVHADEALAMIDRPSEREASVLGAIRYTRNDVWLHTDRTRLPANPAARASWNYVVEASGDVSVTYWLNALQGIASRDDYCVTLNPSAPIAPRHVLARFTARHPLFDAGATRAQAELPRLQGPCRTYFAGAYFGYGFHEDGMRAGLAAAAQVMAT